MDPRDSSAPPPPHSFPAAPLIDSAPNPASAGFAFSPVNFSGGSLPEKKKRGRPRKYSDATTLGLATSPASAGSTALGTPRTDSSTKRRGRPPGSSKKQLDAIGSFGVGFTPHVIMVHAGEDIASKILAFSQQGPRTVCILSANGAVSYATLCHPSISGGAMTYEGRYEIISLSGSYLPSESNGSLSRTGGLSVSLAGPDGNVMGGGVAGVLRAAVPVQVIVGSFIADGKKPKSGPSSASPTNTLNFEAPVTGSSPPSQLHSTDSEEENGNGNGNFNQEPIFYNNNNASQAYLGMPVHPNMMWPNPTAQMLPQ